MADWGALRRAALVAAFALTPIAAAGAATASDPIDTAFTAPGPYATTTGTVSIGSTVAYDLFYPSNYAALGFQSPIVTWGNGSGGNPHLYTTLLSHLASYGFTVIASTLPNTGSGREIDAAAHYLVGQDTAKGSVFDGHLDVHHIAAVGHSQGATGVVRAAVADPKLITAVLTFSLPARIWSLPNPDCPTSADCTPEPWLLTQPIFFVSTTGPEDEIIDGPANARLEYNQVKGHAAMGVILDSGGKPADHSSIKDAADGGNPAGEIGYATAWLEDTLRGNTLARGAFTGPHPELLHNTDWIAAASK